MFKCRLLSKIKKADYSILPDTITISRKHHFGGVSTRLLWRERGRTSARCWIIHPFHGGKSCVRPSKPVRTVDAKIGRKMLS